MTLAIIALLMGFSPGASAGNESCEDLWAQYYNSMKPTMNLDGSLEVAEDDDPDTVQIVLVKGLSRDEGQVSENGQVLYAPYEVMTNEKEGPIYLQKLMGKSLVRRILASESVECPEPKVN